MKRIIRILLALSRRRLIILSDKKYIKLKFKLLCNKKLNLKDPQSFNEKIQWLKLYDRNPKYTKMVDKYEAKKYVSSMIGEEYIIPTLAVYKKFDEIEWDKLPDKFVIKCTHDSGGLVICNDKRKIDKEKAKKKINKSLKKNYYYYSKEWPYKNVKPRIIIEKYLKDDKEEDLKDYKFMCFGGKVKCSFVCLNRNSEKGLHINFYDLDWNKMPFKRHYPNSNTVVPKPINYELMIKLAEKLAKDIPFVRVDFYEVNGNVYFGELTFYPGSGMEEFEPEEYDKILGDMLMLPTNKVGEKNEE